MEVFGKRYKRAEYGISKCSREEAFDNTRPIGSGHSFPYVVGLPESIAEVAAGKVEFLSFAIPDSHKERGRISERKETEKEAQKRGSPRWTTLWCVRKTCPFPRPP